MCSFFLKEKKTHQVSLKEIPFIQFQCKNYACFMKIKMGASLVAQWLRICLSMQGTRVRALVWEDPTCHGATRPVSHNY